MEVSDIKLQDASSAAKEEMNTEIAILAHQVGIQSEEDYQRTAEVLLGVKEKIKQIDEKRKSFVGPLNKVVKEINAFFKQPLDQYREAEAVLKKAMAEFQAQVYARRQKALAEAAAQVQTENTQAFQSMMLQASQHQQPTATGTHTTTRWGFEIEDASKIPREFLCVDERKLRAYATVMKDKAQVPGVRFFEKVSIVARGR